MNTKNRMIAIRLSQNDLDALKQKAKEERLTVASLVRTTVSKILQL